MGSLKFIFAWMLILDVQCDSHRLLYLYSAFTRPEGSSVFSAVGLFDDRQISHYSNELKTWKRDDPDSDIWTVIEEPRDSRDWFVHEIKTLAVCASSRCHGLHTLQRRIGCEVDAMMKVNVFDEYGYDGEDFTIFNPDTMQWMDKNPKAEETKLKWNRNNNRNQYLKTYLNNCCTWISTFNASVASPPDVQMFASEAPHDRSELNLTCLATGFYPKHTEMKITLNDKLQPFISTGVRPNNNETFQMRVSVRVNRDETNGYECHITHSSLTRPYVIPWDGDCINCSKESRSHACAAAAAAAALFLFVVILILRNIRKSMMNQLKL